MAAALWHNIVLAYQDLRESWGIVLGAGVAAAALTMLVTAAAGEMRRSEEDGCRKRWADSGYAVRWDQAAGCRVESAPGRWVPEGAVRATRPAVVPMSRKR